MSKRNRAPGANIEVWEIHGVLEYCYNPENADEENTHP
jgi:hypothetical protein